MKILKSPIDNWKKVVTCSHCEAEMEVDSKDLNLAREEQEHPGGMSSITIIYYVNCGVCSSRVTVDGDELNYAVRTKAKDTTPRRDWRD
jgi:transcription elongation factor Elf1